MSVRKLPYDATAARRHLMRADPVMRDIVRRVGSFDLQIRARPYASLVRGILYQQLASAAAAAIERRFLALFGGSLPRAEDLLAASLDDLRGAGLSRQKAAYLKSIAEHFAAGIVSDRRLQRATDEHVIAAVTEIKGVGRWTADMLLLFSLGRPDVLPVGDLGVRSSMRDAYGLQALPDPETMERIAEPWRPYRSAATWYLWRRSELATL